MLASKVLLNRCTRAYTLQQHGTRASLSLSVNAKAFPARPLADSETNKLPGGHGQLAVAVAAVSCSVKKASQPRPFALNRCCSPGTCFCFRQGACHSHQPLLAACLLFPNARLTLQHGQSHVLLACRQSSGVVGWTEQNSRLHVRHGAVLASDSAPLL